MKYKHGVLVVTLAVLSVGVSLLLWQRGKTDNNHKDTINRDDISDAYSSVIDKFGEDFSILVDFSLPSSQHRFFVIDNATGEVVSRSKCAHGLEAVRLRSQYSQMPVAATVPV